MSQLVMTQLIKDRIFLYNKRMLMPFFQMSPVMILIALDQSVSDCYLSSTHLAEKNSGWNFQRGLGGEAYHFLLTCVNWVHFY